SQEGVRRALGRLSEHGLVERIEHRGSTLYTLNRDHLAMPVVNLLTSMRTDLIRKIRAVVTSWSPQPIHLSMFGSAARADGGTESDIDLLLIRPEGVESVDEGWNRQMNNLRESIQLWTGNRVSYTQYDEKDFRELFTNRKEPFLKEWREDAIDLGGMSTHSIGWSQ
ncbi:MAG: nucleotidyltransferase domain-containing protein, partial [Candidatus Dormibacteraceae bacterium]